MASNSGFKMKIFLSAALIFTFKAFAQDHGALLADFKTMASKSGLSPLSQQSYCYSDVNGIHGYQVDKLQRIASVTKLFTTFFATETLDLNKQFETKVFISGESLHISGSRDPYFEEEKILLLMKGLNDLGHKSFKKVTFDSQFKFYDLALESHANITPKQTKERLAVYLSPKNNEYIKLKWAMINKFAQEENINLDPSQIPQVEALSIELSEINPLEELSPTLYIHRSKPLHSIIKSMNVMSKNLVAQNIFLEASKVKKFETLMAENGIDMKTYQILNGSGLPLKSANSRRDNLATCRTVIKVVELLNKTIETQKFLLSDLVAVNGGKDLGSFRERFKLQPETHEAVLSKTGTVANTSTLAGVLMMENHLPFAILNSTAKPSLGRTFQDNFVARMFHHLGIPVPISYTKLSIFPWDGEDFLSTMEEN